MTPLFPYHFLILYMYALHNTEVKSVKSVRFHVQSLYTFHQGQIFCSTLREESTHLAFSSTFMIVLELLLHYLEHRTKTPGVIFKLYDMRGPCQRSQNFDNKYRGGLHRWPKGTIYDCLQATPTLFWNTELNVQ